MISGCQRRPAGDRVHRATGRDHLPAMVIAEAAVLSLIRDPSSGFDV
ncbi:hypothetical protein [Stenomitos frigidus]|nr:hypothetical protein [Stenomitos frigidus]